MSDRYELIKAVKGIVAAWESGDLAAAVNSARVLVADGPEKNERRAMTVVGTYPDSDESYVEHVEADTVAGALAEAEHIDPERRGGRAIAVFEGHQIDVGPESS